MNELSPVRSARRGIIDQLADRYGLEPEVFRATIRATCMPKDASVEEFIACCMVAFEHRLNPVTKEIYFMRTKEGKIQPIVSVDGWIKKCNEHPKFDGLEFSETLDEKGRVTSIKCAMYRKDRTRPTIITEYLSECLRESREGKKGPWDTHPSRMLRHRALIQAARIAFGFAGIMERDEFDQWQDQDMRDVTPATAATPLPIPDIPDDIPEIEPQESPADDDAETIADMEGFLAKLKEDRELCDSAEELNELAEGNADIIERLRPADQERARAILRIDE